MGVDPGSICTGFGIVENDGRQLRGVHWGAIRSKPKEDFPLRLKTIYDNLFQVMKEFSPQVVAIEDLFFATNAKSTIKLGQARGVAILAAVNLNIELAEYAPLEIKQSIVGYGRADKNQVRDMVTTLLKLKEKPEPLDVSDALAVAICHAHSSKNRLLKKASLKG